MFLYLFSAQEMVHKVRLFPMIAYRHPIREKAEADKVGIFLQQLIKEFLETVPPHLKEGRSDCIRILERIIVHIQNPEEPGWRKVYTFMSEEKEIGIVLFFRYQLQAENIDAFKLIVNDEDYFLESLKETLKFYESVNSKGECNKKLVALFPRLFSEKAKVLNVHLLGAEEEMFLFQPTSILPAFTRPPGV